MTCGVVGIQAEGDLPVLDFGGDQLLALALTGEVGQFLGVRRAEGDDRGGDEGEDAFHNGMR
ncbi:MAG: hypothetical protein GXY24_08215 [Bacteroidales bacterium]|nr:hypothetical protein [Bacteroidales bacterium]